MTNNQYVNKVELGDQTLMDITDTTATPADVAQGKTFYGANGARLTGTNTGGGESTPTGTVIYYAGTTAPSGYLACDGTVYNIADYPALAQFFADNYDANNYWGGDGTATFAVPDWQGEFFRASGTNSHADQGGGGTVGAHQNATVQTGLYRSGAAGNPLYVYSINQNSGTYGFFGNSDQGYSVSGTRMSINAASVTDTSSITWPVVQSRPTNTSLLVCIKAA